jgi:hypothetical protein
MFNSRNLGALVVKEDPHVQNWEDARYGIQEMFIEESYGFGIINEGLVGRECLKAGSFALFWQRKAPVNLGFCPCRTVCRPT